MYKLNYLPVALNDMVDILKYISIELGNPVAANKLANKFVQAAEGLKTFPYANRVFMPIKPLSFEYRRLFVQNFIMFYWIDDSKKCITIARVVYCKSDYTDL